MTEPQPKRALIIGASRGLGHALCAEYLKRGWHVSATVRGEKQGALHELAARAGRALEIEQLDINEPPELARLAERLAARRFELLFVNAGIANDPAETAGQISTEDFVRIMLTNALSPMRVIESLAPLVTPGGTIGVMSSGLGSLTNNESGGWELYRASKAALNMLMRSYALRDPDPRRTHLIIAPGWVRTDMGGPSATLSIDESIPRVVDTISSASGRPGLRYLDYRGQTVPW